MAVVKPAMNFDGTPRLSWRVRLICMAMILLPFMAAAGVYRKARFQAVRNEEIARAADALSSMGAEDLSPYVGPDRPEYQIAGGTVVFNFEPAVATLAKLREPLLVLRRPISLNLRSKVRVEPKEIQQLIDVPLRALASHRFADHHVAALVGFTQLELLDLSILDLSGRFSPVPSAVTDACVEDLAKIKSLRCVLLMDTRVSQAGVLRLQTLRPDLVVVRQLPDFFRHEMGRGIVDPPELSSFRVSPTETIKVGGDRGVSRVDDQGKPLWSVACCAGGGESYDIPRQYLIPETEGVAIVRRGEFQRGTVGVTRIDPATGAVVWHRLCEAPGGTGCSGGKHVGVWIAGQRVVVVSRSYVSTVVDFLDWRTGAVLRHWRY